MLYYEDISSSAAVHVYRSVRVSGETKMSIEVLVEGEGLVDVEVIRLPPGSAAREIVVAVAAKGGFPPEEAVLFLEDGDELVDLVAAVVEESYGGRVHHVHRLHHVEVEVFYKEQCIKRRFRPSARVQRVLDWAAGPDGFKGIDPVIVPELELALHGTSRALPKNAHVGRYVRHPEPCLKLDLIRGVIPNGCR